MNEQLNIDDLVRHIRVTISLLSAEVESEPVLPSDFLRGYTHGALDAYRNILRALEVNDVS